MKIVKIFAAVIVLVSALVFIGCKGSTWAAKIEGEVITVDELNLLYYSQHKQLLNLSKKEIDKYANDPEATDRFPTLNKRIFLDELIKQRLVYNKAVDEGYLKNDEVRAIIRIATEGAVVQSYIKDKFKDDAGITDADVEEQYRKDRNSVYKGVPIEQAENHIRQKLVMMRLQKKTMDMVENLKEVARIEKNPEIFKKTDEPIKEEEVKKEIPSSKTDKTKSDKKTEKK
jgi:hypothetical protein